jgi:hypothetical protein
MYYSIATGHKLRECGGICEVAFDEFDTEGGQGCGFSRGPDQRAYAKTLVQ